MSICRVFSCVVGRGCLLWPVHSLGKTLLAFVLLHFVLQGQICLLLQVSRLSTFAFHSPMKRTSFLGISSRRSCRSSQNHSTSVSSALLFGAQIWITLVLNGLPWKWTESILLFLKLCASTALWTLLLTMMVTSFLLSDSCPHIMAIWVKFTHSSPF